MTNKLRQKVIKNILKECYWDYNLSMIDLENILYSENMREKQKIFSKVIYNSRDKLLSLKLFSRQELEVFFQDLKITYNEKYIFKHVLILKALLLGEKNDLKSLEWKKL